MSKAKTLATTVSTGNVLADGTVAYAEVSGTPTLATVATTGAYGDVSGTPTLATVATSGSYTDLTDKPTISATATNIAGGSNGTIPYQSAADTTAMLAAGTAGQLLQTNGAGAPSWVAAPTGGFTLGTPVATTSGTAIDITGIPAGTKQIIISIDGLSTNGTAQKIIQLGTASSVEGSGYTSFGASIINTTALSVNGGDGFTLVAIIAAQAISGSVQLTLQNETTNTWSLSGNMGTYGAGNAMFMLAGVKSLSGVLTRIRLTQQGVNTFDAGQMNIAYI